MANKIIVGMVETFDNDPAIVQLAPGYIVSMGGGMGRPYIVERVTDCSALISPLNSTPKRVEINGRQFQASVYSDSEHIASRVGREALLERNPPRVSELYLAVKKGLHRMGNKQQNTESSGENSIMKEVNELPKGRLAADAIKAKAGTKMSTKAAKADDGSKGKLGQIFGNSITSIVRLLGNNGLTVKQILKALKGQKVTPAEATVKIQRCNGINATNAELRKTLAVVTKEQLAELVKDAGPAEVEAPKEAKRPGKKKASAPASAEAAAPVAA